MLYPIELWVPPKGTGNYKPGQARASGICASARCGLPRGASRLQPDRSQIQRVPPVFDGPDSQTHLAGRGDLDHTELHAFDPAVVARGRDGAARVAIADGYFQ